MTRFKSLLATIVCVVTVLSCSTVMAFAGNEGRHYYDSFSTTSSQTTSSHLYGYRDIAFICRNLKSSNPSGENFTVKLQTYDSGKVSWTSFASVSCNTNKSNGGYTYYNANTNTTLSKRGRFVISKNKNNYSVAGQLESYSSEV